MAQKKFAVIGAGQFGQAISLALSEKGFEVLVIDKDMKKVQNISDDVAYAVCTDATDKRALLNENIKDFDAVIVAIGDDFVERLLCISNLIDLGINKIYCRTKGAHQQTILEKMGITEEEYTRRDSADFPQRRYQTVNEIGRLAAFLLSEANGSLTGQAFLCDGAMTTAY